MQMAGSTSVEDRIAAMTAFGALLQPDNADLQQLIRRTGYTNGWFTEEESWRMLESFRTQFLDAQALRSWMERYKSAPQPRTVALVLAGNVPFVGMHDLLCVLMSGHQALVKLSSKDPYFFPWMQEQLQHIAPEIAGQIRFTEKLEDFDAVIATGSNNSARYFQYYFGKYPHIIRKNRTSVAILTGDETEDDLRALGKDVFYYYGLGCRNVGKVFIPEGYDIQNLFRYWEDYRYVIDHMKYKNNYDYNRALLLLNNTYYLTNDFYMLVESDQLFSPLSVLYFETYKIAQDLEEKISAIAENLQCVVSLQPGNTPFGKTQFPGLSDYADHADTMQFLSELP